MHSYKNNTSVERQFTEYVRAAELNVEEHLTKSSVSFLVGINGLSRAPLLWKYLKSAQISRKKSQVGDKMAVAI